MSPTSRTILDVESRLVLAALLGALALSSCRSLPGSPATDWSRRRAQQAEATGTRIAPERATPEPAAPPAPPPPPPPPPPICLALSVGEFKGIAHLGAIKALKDAHVAIDCVVGNSMGSLIGALYASAPEEDTTTRFRDLTAAYTTASRRAAPSGIFAVFELFSPRFHRMSLARMTIVLNEFLVDRTIESMPVKFATAGQRMDNREVVYATSGNVAHAVGNSIANPQVFEDVDPRTRPMVDPGLDQISATPISATCRLFPAHRIIAVNVTVTRPVREEGTACPVLEVSAYPGEVSTNVLTDAQEFERVVGVGHEATQRAIAESGWAEAE